MLERMLRIGRMLDLYGPLLTDKQRHCIERHYLEDLSLGEIAAELQVSRQAVHDLLRRSESLLEEYDQKLGFINRLQKQEKLLETLRQQLQSAELTKKDKERLQPLLSELDRLVEEAREA